MKIFYSLILSVLLILSCNPSKVDQMEDSNSDDTLTISQPEILPMIIAESPINGSVVSASVVTVTFNKTMDSETINSNTFKITLNNIDVPGTVVYDDLTNTAVFTPSSLFSEGETYIATVMESVLDVDGNSLISGNLDNPWSFTISTVPIIPAIIAVYPTVNEICVSICTPIVIVYNVHDVIINFKLIRTDCIDSSENVTKCIVPCEVSGKLTQHGNVWIFIPSSSLSKNTKYTAIVTGTVEKIWNFTTLSYCDCK